jgi:hypothetical protein
MDAVFNLSAVAAVFNLNHHATELNWHFIHLSLSNILVIAVMFVVFFAAILLPFPHHEATGSVGEAPASGSQS